MSCVKSCVKTLALASAAAALLTPRAATAGDLAFPTPPPPPAFEYSGWYLRGDIGAANLRHDRVFNPLMQRTYTALVSIVDKGGFSGGALFGVGVGYQLNPWLRLDATAERRGTTSLRSFHFYDTAGDGAWDGANEYAVRASGWTALANAYVDIGAWWGVTPFVGAGVGAARIDLAGFADHNPPNQSVAYADPTSRWRFAWALHAGLAYRVAPQFAVELAYRYLALGDAETGDVVSSAGQNNVYNPTSFSGLTSHDLRLGVRWMLEPEALIPRPPLVGG